MNKLLNITQMCTVFCCTNEELMKFVHQGMPHIGRGSNMRFNLKTCQAWYSGEFDDMQNAAKENEQEYIRIIGTLQKDIEEIIKAAQSPDIDKTTIVNMLKLALAQSDKDCSLIVKRKIEEAKKL